MRAWTIQSYNEPLAQVEIPIPRLKRDNQVLLRVMAASVNPIDILLCKGYGKALLGLQARMGLNDGGPPDPKRILAAVTSQPASLAADRLPLVPGRDCSGEVVEIGGRAQAQDIEIGDQVIAVVPPECQGCHADYVAVPDYALAPKPTALGHTEAASLPYVACTAWAALVTTARIRPDNAQGMRVLIHGGAGGVGSIAIQMLKCWGADRVVATCSREKMEMVAQLGARAVDYGAEDAKEQIIEQGPYEVVLDCASTELAAWSDSVLGIWRNCVHVTLNSPLVGDTDRYGPLGLVTTATKLFSRNLTGGLLRNGQLFLPAFFSPNAECLDWTVRAAQDGKIRPQIDQVFPFAELPKAFEKVAQLHGKGKTVIDLAQ